MENLLHQRDELLAKIQRIAESCEGLENEANARRVTELNVRQAELLAQKGELQTKLSALDGELGTIGRNILELSGSGIEKILQAIKNQRWFFLANKPKVLFDRDSALLWADLNHFPFGKNNNNDWYSYLYDYSEANDLMTKITSERWGGFGDWKIPTAIELWNLVKDKNFPFRLKGGSYGDFNIQARGAWLVINDGKICIKDLSYAGATSNLNNGRFQGGFVIPCSHAYVPADYENNISPTNNFYTETEKLQFTLNVFTQNELIPMFDDAAITQLYRQIFVEKPALMKQLAEVEAQIAELETSQVKLTANFDYRPLLKEFDTAAVDKSVIKYSEAVLSVTDELLDILSEYEAAQAETIAEFLKIALKLNAKLTDNPHLTAEENALLAARQKFLSQRLALGTDEVKAQILSVKAQAEELSARIDKINRRPNSIRQLAELEAEPRASFELLVENLARIIRDAQRKVDFFTAHKDLVAAIVDSQAAWNESYKVFKTSLHEELTAVCREDGIDEEIFTAWYDDWQTKRFAIEQRFLPLVEFALKGNILDAVEDVLRILQDYRDAVATFYLNERKNIYQKFAFQDGGDLQEKFETESELYKLAEKLQRDLQTIIFARDKTEERIFLLKWAEPLLNISIDEISNFIRDRELDAISEEVLTQFAALRRQNFASYIADSKTYGEALQKREREFNALIFRMRKDLHRR